MPLQFAPVRPEHAEPLSALFERNSGAAITELFDPFPLTTGRAWQIATERRRDRYYVASSGGRLLAMSMLRGFDEGYEIPSFGIFVDHASHRRGIGRRLTAWTLEAARRLGCPGVRLSVYAENPVAVRLYQAIGFLEQGRESVERDRESGGPDRESVERDRESGGSDRESGGPDRESVEHDRESGGPDRESVERAGRVKEKIVMYLDFGGRHG